MAKVYFTYVWGQPTAPAWPLTFSTKAARRFARETVEDGDGVFTVATKGDPTPGVIRGRVTGFFKLTDLEVNTADYDLPRNAKTEYDTTTKFPYALHPLEVWAITSPDNVFSKLVGPLTPTHHLKAQSGLVELDVLTAQILLGLDRREILPVMLPSTEFGRGLVARKNSKLAPKHIGAFSGTFPDHAVWYVYALGLQDARGNVLALKIGYSHAPGDRLAAYNSVIASEATGLQWHLVLSQPTSSEDAARTIEQALFKRYAAKRLASNGEIIMGVGANDVIVATSTLMREMSYAPT